MRKRTKTRQHKLDLIDWAAKVKARDGGKCVCCGKTSFLQSHHLICRKYRPLSLELANGVTTCPSCHKLNPLRSFHGNPIWAMEWLEANRPAQLATLRALCHSFA